MSEETTWPTSMPPFEDDTPSMMDSVVDAAMAVPPVEEEKAVVETKRKYTKRQSDNRKDCEICGKNYSIKHLYAHKRKVHGIFGGRTGITRAPYNRKETLEIASVPKVNGAPLAPLSAEQVTRAAAEALWPDGVPHDMLTALMRWNIQTHYFLAEVQQ